MRSAKRHPSEDELPDENSKDHPSTSCVNENAIKNELSCRFQSFKHFAPTTAYGNNALRYRGPALSASRQANGHNSARAKITLAPGKQDKP